MSVPLTLRLLYLIPLKLAKIVLPRLGIRGWRNSIVYQKYLESIFRATSRVKRYQACQRLSGDNPGHEKGAAASATAPPHRVESTLLFGVMASRMESEIRVQLTLVAASLAAVESGCRGQTMIVERDSCFDVLCDRVPGMCFRWRLTHEPDCAIFSSRT
jgi:hypothetical protein